MKRFNLILIAALLSCTTGQEAAFEPAVVKDYPVNELYQIFPDSVVQGNDKRAWVVSADEIRSTYTTEERVWQRKNDLSAFPEFQAPNMPILEAVTRLALEEALLNVVSSGPNAGGFSAGAKWPGVWTRDISYSIHLALAWIMPTESQKSLLLKVNSLPEVIQDTGTGGSWPVSTDRTVWSLAAWELFVATGDRDWLTQAYTILKNTALRDRKFARDEFSGLYRGETSFMDWREQTYPRWMNPVDIAESKALGTNILHWNTLKTLIKMGNLLNQPRTELQQWQTWAQDLEQKIQTRFWLADKNYYSAYEYGIWQADTKTDKSDTLANSLGVLLGAFPDTQAAQVMMQLPVVPFGPPIIYPQLPNIPPYHNRGIWPFVTAYYSLAAARVGNLEGFEFGLKSNLRAAALFLTHKENMVYSNGHHLGTQVNSDRQLWSVAGWLAQIYRGLMGLQLSPEGIRFQPSVPDSLLGPFILKGFKFRGAKLDVEVEGSGDQIQSLLVNGEVKDPKRFVLNPQPGSNTVVKIVLQGRRGAGGINMGRVEAVGMRDTRVKATQLDNQVRLFWEDNGYQVPYVVYQNDKPVATIQGLESILVLTETDRVLRFSVQAQPTEGYPSNLSNYVLVAPGRTRLEIKAVDGRFQNVNRKSPVEELGLDRDYLELSGEARELIEWDVEFGQTGIWVLRFRYANGNGPISTDNKCALRTVSLNGTMVGKVLFPQTGNWTDRVWSTGVYLRPRPGKNTLTLWFSPEDLNMDGKVNQAHIDTVELVRYAP